LDLQSQKFELALVSFERQGACFVPSSDRVRAENGLKARALSAEGHMLQAFLLL
ncbi:hypothetical protein Tco_1563851, partial [Tanacetum coccineum]